MQTRPEKTDLTVAFIPIVCAAPLLYAHRHGFFERNGLSVTLTPAPGWSGVKELLVHRRIDAAHMLCPMPFACTLGIDGRRAEVELLAMQNVNGTAVTLAAKHRGIAGVAAMKGLTLGVPYRFSMQYYLLCDWLAKHGVDPLHDVRIVEVSPPRMPFYLERGSVDGVLAPEPFNEIIVASGLGFMYTRSKALWGGHPCCSLAAHAAFRRNHAAACAALTRGLLEAQLALHTAGRSARAAIAQELADSGHLNEEPAAITAALVNEGVDFLPHTWPEYGTWILAQMQRWGQLRRRVPYGEVTRAVMNDVQALAAEVGFEAPRTGVENMPPVGGDDPFRFMLAQPFAAFREGAEHATTYGLPAPAAARLSTILNVLADVAGGHFDVRLEVTSGDEIGELEQTVNEILTNVRFSADALLEQKSRLEKHTAELRAQVALIEEQRDAIRALSMPIIEVGEGILALPVIGAIDDERVATMTETLLTTIVKVKATHAILDLTSVAAIDAPTADHIVRIARTVGLVGTRALLSGIQATTAQTIASLDDLELGGIKTFRTLRQAIAYCQRAARD